MHDVALLYRRLCEGRKCAFHLVNLEGFQHVLGILLEVIQILCPRYQKCSYACIGSILGFFPFQLGVVLQYHLAHYLHLHILGQGVFQIIFNYIPAPLKLMGFYGPVLHQQGVCQRGIKGITAKKEAHRVVFHKVIQYAGHGVFAVYAYLAKIYIRTHHLVAA
ncbi:MAG: hypothetical protein WC271_15650 [Bacteroidales bacterium]|nr:hypothetical protein [Bacteroidales bacterium]